MNTLEGAAGMSTVGNFGNFASSNMIQEATAFKTVKAGQYEVQLAKVYEMNEAEGFARIGLNVVSEGQKRGMVFTKVQWKEARNAGGKLKGGCKLFSQLLKALHPTATIEELSQIDATTLLSEFERYSVSAFISEFYQIPDDSNPPYKSRRAYPKTAEEIADALKASGVAKNDVVSLYAKK